MITNGSKLAQPGLAASYVEAGLREPFVQDNLSRSTRGTLRGLHFQDPNAQGKLVTVLRGAVLVRCNLRGVNLCSADLTGVRLVGCETTGVYLEGATL